MRELLTPKQVGRAIDVSESSVKRWCDRGEIATHYTSGGHRRIALSTLLALVRDGKYTLVNPAALGLPASGGHSPQAIDRARDALTESLLAGDESRCRQLILDLYLADHSLSLICDEVIAAAFTEIGERWACAGIEVYRERRGCEIALRGLHELRSLLPALAPNAPLALGATASGDPYMLASAMAELVLRAERWQAVSLGHNLPFPTLEAAIRDNRPRLFWLSCSHIVDERAFLAGYTAMFEQFQDTVAFVVGGNALNPQLRRRMKFAACCDNMQHLVSFAQTLWTALESRPSAESPIYPS